MMTRFSPQGNTSFLIRSDKHEGTGTDDFELTSGVGVKGAWVEIVASTSIFTNYLILVTHDATIASDFSVDVGIGAAASETILIPDVRTHVSTAGNNIISIPYPIKVEIPPGTRISARCQNVAAESIDINLLLSGT